MELVVVCVLAGIIVFLVVAQGFERHRERTQRIRESDRLATLMGDLLVAEMSRDRPEPLGDRAEMARRVDDALRAIPGGDLWRSGTAPTPGIDDAAAPSRAGGGGPEVLGSM